MHRPQMDPVPGEHLLRFVGDSVRFRVWHGGDVADFRAFLRTNLGRAGRVREEVIRSYASKLPSSGAAWRDIAMHRDADSWFLELPLVEVGYFQAKAYVIDPSGRQAWPEGPNVGIAIHPDQYRTTNTIYCAFVRMFGGNPPARSGVEPSEADLLKLDRLGYTVIPSSGTLRDLAGRLPHIIETLGCRVVHLLPVNPAPTTYARFGRYGSPYASQDLTAVDPALVEFDRRTTGIDQFRELTYAVHSRGARVFLDIVTNHTGWGSTLQENHPDWFLRESSGRFVSPGAWGVTWEDLVELNHRNPASWEHLAEVFLTWCRRGVDGFRCDAGYKVPMPAWRYITSCVREEYPETIFLLEGLGGSWDATESLLTDGGMQWAYSELFQNYSGSEVADYLEYAHRQSRRAGLYVHYSETHDNDRLAKRGRLWSLLRNRLCALTSVSGGYGFTCGVEWLATEQVNVHSNRSLNWGNHDHLIRELSALNRLLSDHPCFFDNARLVRLSAPNSPVYALRRESGEGTDNLLILINTDSTQAHRFTLETKAYRDLREPGIDLLGQDPPLTTARDDQQVLFTLAPGACHCLAAAPRPTGLAGDSYRRMRACAAFGLRALSQVLPVEQIGPFSWRVLGDRVDRNPAGFLAALRHIDLTRSPLDLVTALDSAIGRAGFAEVVVWERIDARRVTLVPPLHWLLIRDDVPFRASLTGDGRRPSHVQSVHVANGFVAFFPPSVVAEDARVLLERYAPAETHVQADVRFLSGHPNLAPVQMAPVGDARCSLENVHVLLTNGRGGMARFCADFGQVTSKYDAALAANLHASVPVDRHVLVKRCRAWVVADRFITPLDRYALALLDPGPPAIWRFKANAGDGRTVEVELRADMLEGRNSTVLRFSRPVIAEDESTALPDSCEVRLTVRVDLEDRNFHAETRRNGGADHHFAVNCRPLADGIGFEFAPTADRQLRVFADAGSYHHEAEWSENIPHPLEQSRGQVDRGDAYSPGWFDLPLPRGASATVVLCADAEEPARDEVQSFGERRVGLAQQRMGLANLPAGDAFGQRLVLAAHQFVVRRGEGKTVVAGYPWFLDWGRDTLICARGLISAGLGDDVRQILATFGRFEENGTLPNSIYGEDASNRDTSDAPLWFGIVCEEAGSLPGQPIPDLAVDPRGRTIRDVLRDIAEGYLRGTPNGIHVDPPTGLVWSPSHFTWMDTNYPAGTPREGYPVEIQVLWIRLLRQLARIDLAHTARWTDLASRSQASFLDLFWLEEQGYLADVILASRGQTASLGTVDRALRSNYLFAVALGLLSGERARRSVDAALRYLVIPGALRSLAPLPVSPPLPIVGNHGLLLNDPERPYWGRYEGDEDTRRKPAYHNGTAWTWTFPTFCEALVRAWEFDAAAVASARAYLASMDRLLDLGCLGQIPEILDGDAPHAQRGCDAQAWGVTEALRVWKWLEGL